MKIQCPKCLQRVEIEEPALVGDVCPACGEEIPLPLDRGGGNAVPVAPENLGLLDSSKFWIGLVVGVVLVLGGGAFVLMKLGERKLERVLERGQQARMEQDFRTLETALTVYRMNANAYPSTGQGLEALVSKPTTGKIPRSWEPALREEMLDPWGQPYGYRFPPDKNRGEPDLFSSGPDGQAGSEDDFGNWQLRR